MPLFEIPDRIEEGGMGGYIFNGNKILVAKYEGKYYAIDAKCPHLGGDLSQGKLVGKKVTCPRHKRKTDITTGIHGGIIGLPFLKQSSKKVKVYQVITEGQKVKVDL
ncbi:Rieske (2Fe-2S) protein [Chloroflexota bacterium]